MAEQLRAATCNLQTGIGTTRGYWRYLLTGWKYLLPHGSAPVRQASSFLTSERVDVAARCEILAQRDEPTMLAGDFDFCVPTHLPLVAEMELRET